MTPRIPFMLYIFTVKPVRTVCICPNCPILLCGETLAAQAYYTLCPHLEDPDEYFHGIFIASSTTFDWGTSSPDIAESLMKNITRTLFRTRKRLEWRRLRLPRLFLPSEMSEQFLLNDWTFCSDLENNNQNNSKFR